MKYISIFLSIILFSCATYDNSSIGSTFYNVTKIDSINSYYLIYAKRHDTIFKIVSKKEYTINCNTIRVNSKYNFDLHSIRENAPIISGIKINPINHMDINCYQFDEETSICREKGIYDLYFSHNVKGLCIIK
jgi:hypothetical protein